MKLKMAMAIGFLLCVSSAQAQMYRWIDADGRIHFSDQPPPAKYLPKQHDLHGAAEGGGNGGLNYALSQAASNFPVTLYTGNECAPCDEGRAMLKKRGIPFSEKTVKTNEDIDKLKAAGGDGRLPLLTVGRYKHIGFVQSEWNATLTAAGYPESSQLPPGYRHPSAEPAAPQTPKPAAKPVEVPGPVERQPADGGNAPPGFRF